MRRLTYFLFRFRKMMKQKSWRWGEPQVARQAPISSHLIAWIRESHFCSLWILPESWKQLGWSNSEVILWYVGEQALGEDWKYLRVQCIIPDTLFIYFIQLLSLILFWDRVLLCSLGWLWTWNPLVLASQVLDLQCLPWSLTDALFLIYEMEKIAYLYEMVLRTNRKCFKLPRTKMVATTNLVTFKLSLGD
jgi:hypothetical protein